jgi:hypothetical protein
MTFDAMEVRFLIEKLRFEKKKKRLPFTSDFDDSKWGDHEP